VSPVYLDSNASTQVDPRVRQALWEGLVAPGNPHSDHRHGRAARVRLDRALARLGALFDAPATAVVPTSGATEALDLAHRGLGTALGETGRTHVVTTAIEHKASLQAARRLGRRGDLTVVDCGPDGRVRAADILAALRPDTGLVSVQHVNNETGALQPIEAIAAGLRDHPAFFHVDAAQSFGKQQEPLRRPRIDLISFSGHKVHAPAGTGGLLVRERAAEALQATLPGRSVAQPHRPGTPATALVEALALAGELAVAERPHRRAGHEQVRAQLLALARRHGAVVHTPVEHALPHVLCFALPGVESEVARMVLGDLVSVGNGAACAAGAPSHVLSAMGVPAGLAACTLRWSWSHLTPAIPWEAIDERWDRLMRMAA